MGRDDVGRRLLKSLPARVSRAAIVRPAGYHTPVKTRILAGGIHSAKQQVVRIDRITVGGAADRTRLQFSAAARRAVAAADAVIVSDYGSGLVTPELVDDLRRRAQREGVPFLLDSRHDTLKYPRADGVHAERIGSRADAGRGDRRRCRPRSNAPAARC